MAEVGDQRGARPDVLRAGELLVGRVDEHRHVVLAADALGEADVIGVGVGEHERAHVGPGVAEPGEAGDELVVERRDAGVDDRDAAGVLDDVVIDQVAAQPMQPLGDARHFRLTI